MKMRYLCILLCMAVSMMLMGCSEGKELVGANSPGAETEIVSGGDGSQNEIAGTDGEAAKAGDSLKEELSEAQDVRGAEGTANTAYAGDTLEPMWSDGFSAGGIYRVVSWSLAETLEESGTSAEGMTESERELLSGDSFGGILLVTMEMMNTPDYSGNVAEEFYANGFKPVTRVAIENAYLPEAEPDTEPRLCVEEGNYPYYLDITDGDEKGYFRLDAPAEGETITYTIGYVLSETEYAAAKSGELYLWWTNDMSKTGEDMQMLWLSPDSRETE